MKEKYFLILLLLASLNTLGILYFFDESLERSDTFHYVRTIEYFLGKIKTPPLFILVKPLSMITASIFSLLVEPRLALFLQNLFLYFGSIILVFKIIEYLYFNKKQAFYGSILFMTSFPVLSSGLAFLTDMTGWFFCFLTIYLVLHFYFKPQINLSLLIGFLSGIGFLFKESGAAGGVFFVFLLLIAKKFSWKEKIKYSLIFLSCFILPILISSFLIYNKFHYSWIDLYKANLKSVNEVYTLKGVIGELMIAYTLSWFFILKGAWQEWKTRKENPQRGLVLLAMAPLAFCGLLWPCPLARVFFLGAAPFLILGSRGILFKKKNLEIIFLGLIIVLNYALPNLFSIQDLNILLDKIF